MADLMYLPHRRKEVWLVGVISQWNLNFKLGFPVIYALEVYRKGTILIYIDAW